MRALLAFLSQLVPLLERRVLASERQATATETVAALLQQLLQMDPAYQEYLTSIDPARSAVDAEVEAVSGPERDDMAIRLEAFRVYWYEQHGALLEDEELIAEFERAYSAAESRLHGPAEAVQ